MKDDPDALENIDLTEESPENLTSFPLLNDAAFNKAPISERIYQFIKFVNENHQGHRILEILRTTDEFISATAPEHINTRIEMNSRVSDHPIYLTPWGNEWNKLVTAFNPTDLDSTLTKEYLAICKQYIQERMAEIKKINENDPYYIYFKLNEPLIENPNSQKKLRI